MKLLIVTLLVCSLLIDVQAWLWRKKSSSCGDHKVLGKPYYFGKTKLICMLSEKGKRAPSRFTFSMSHGWIYYDGLYYEFGVGGAHGYHVAKKPVKGKKCKAHREEQPAGYGVISKECLNKCAQRYKAKYGRYNLFTNNCHKFANRMSKILCNFNKCPKWCS